MYFTIKKIIDGKRFDVICGALQKYTENLLLKWINNCLSNSRPSIIFVWREGWR